MVWVDICVKQLTFSKKSYRQSTTLFFLVQKTCENFFYFCTKTESKVFLLQKPEIYKAAQNFSIRKSYAKFLENQKRPFQKSRTSLFLSSFNVVSVIHTWLSCLLDSTVDLSFVFIICQEDWRKWVLLLTVIFSVNIFHYIEKHPVFIL